MALKDLFDLTGKIALITGGSRGLGLQIAEGLGEYGATVVLTARKQNELDEARAHLSGMGITAHVYQNDLSQFDTIEPLVERIHNEVGPIHILVNNAGATWGAPAEEHPFDAWLKVINLNVNAMFLLTQAVGRRCMIPARSGRVINVASVAGLKGNSPRMMGTLAYNTSKGADVNFTRALAAEWAKYGITVNSICPGYFPTKMTKGTLAYGEEIIVSHTPLGRLGGPEDLKGLALLLASDASAYMTGQNIAVDGGVTAI
ncbi:SDR family oxidoreductase (plasmid) [Deinococcus metallilatus]|uniref:Gluconate 5-dehydrogenase n=1 Tax=Deinococcus metallilatus TaxID=1211322 RepID=A0AAJ5F6W4_9DEIO|nr:SDR family oxidoreductase [Deinococcus metallilatus]MBB5297290.1 gluconate 5-dehydrogenase [Deinococcus metallilatus]QBY06964.1 SDR family oxidoreductase [Deinococcus metallilatus]TLK31911.1 SDR family oxidoreductase [Deinococcus metallilatus]GMA17146.1 gluconate 5-dehydrogenase [Deinococcus metallilatus]